MRGLAALSVTVDSAQKVFNLGVEDIVAGKGLAALKANLWRILVRSDSALLAAA